MSAIFSYGQDSSYSTRSNQLYSENLGNRAQQRTKGGIGPRNNIFNSRADWIKATCRERAV